VGEAVLDHLEGRRHVEDRLAVLAGHDPARRERAAVADAVDLVQDGRRRVPGPQEVGVQRVDGPLRRHGPHRGDERLAGDLPAEDALLGGLRGAAAVQVDLELLEVEDGEEILERGGRAGAAHMCRPPPTSRTPPVM
jgi:hypothetical protein